jgi:hypothetical protein
MARSGHAQMACPLDAVPGRAMVDLSHPSPPQREVKRAIGSSVVSSCRPRRRARPGPPFAALTIGVNDDKCRLLLRMLLFLRQRRGPLPQMRCRRRRSHSSNSAGQPRSRAKPAGRGRSRCQPLDGAGSRAGVGFCAADFLSSSSRAKITARTWSPQNYCATKHSEYVLKRRTIIPTVPAATDNSKKRSRARRRQNPTGPQWPAGHRRR